MELASTMGQWANDVLLWVGFGTLTGLVARAIMPGRDPGGAVATLMMGIGGCILGCGTLMFFQGGRVTPISPLGFVVAIIGAFLLLAINRVLSGKWLKEGTGANSHAPGARRRFLRRGPHTPVAVYDDAEVV